MVEFNYLFLLYILRNVAVSALEGNVWHIFIEWSNNITLNM